jgi:Putative zinc-finger
MTTQAMNHQQAVETMATERYLLGEMTSDQRLAFEEHYMECAECLESVMFGSEFLDAGREVARKQNTERAAQPEPTWRERLQSVTSSFLRPAPAFAFVLFLGLVGVNIYQLNVVKRQNNLIAELKAPKQEFRFVISGGARKERGPAKVLAVGRNGQLNIRFDFTPGDYSGYRAEIVAENGAVEGSLPLSLAAHESSVTISVPIHTLREGKYSAVLRAQSPSGKQEDLADDSFQLQIAK